MNNTSKRDIHFFSRWRMTRHTKQNFSKRPLKLWKYANFTKLVFSSFSQSLNKFLDCGPSLSRPVRFDLCSTNPSVTVSFGQKHRWAMRVSTVLTPDRMDFDAIFQQMNLRYQWAIWLSEILTLDRMDFEMIFQQINLNTALIFPLENLVTKTPLPESFECLFDPKRSFGNPLRTFRQSFASPVLEKSRFFLLRRNFRP